MMTVQVFAEDLVATFEHYRRAFGAVLLRTANGSQDELIHLEMDIMGDKLALAPPLPEGIRAGNVAVLCVKFESESKLRTAYDVLREGGRAGELAAYPWSPLEAYVTDKYGVNWCVGM